ncbi:MAG: hypothetical protein H6835_13005 [Planctomycetes bacterium]|nr:hypothetical protein [Planctomycetota bacterium]
MGKVGDLLRRGMGKAIGAPLKAILPKNPWLRFAIYALPFVLLLALFSPVLDLVLKLLELGLRVIEPLLQTMVGRIVLVLLVFASGGLVMFWLLKSRVRDWRGEAALGRHLQAIAALLGHDRKKSRDMFRKVARYRGPTPDRYAHLVADADLKLARMGLADGKVDEALGWLARISEPGLPKELLRSSLQLRLEALSRQGEVLPATLRREAEAAVERFPKDVRTLALLRDQALGEQRADDALEWQARIAEHATPQRRVEERQRYVDMLLDAGARALRADDLDQAKRHGKRLDKVDPDGPSGKLLLGDVHRAAGELLKAVKVYGATRSPTGLDRIAELLSEHPGAVEPRELLACCPMQGTLLLVARELARKGDLVKAERAARVAAEALGPTPTVCAVLAEVLDLLGQQQKAQLLREQTVARLLGAPAAK